MKLHQRIANPQPQFWVVIVLACVALVLLFFSITSQRATREDAWFDENEQSLYDDSQEQQEAEVSTPSPEESTPPTVSLLFGGDLQFDRHIRQKAEAAGGYAFIFEDLTDLFLESDGVIANLEGPVTEYDSVSVGSAVGSSNNFIFTFSPKIVPVLQSHGFTLLNIGNNHILNFGMDGLEQTEQNLKRADLAYWGNSGKETWLHDSFTIYRQNGVTLLFVNYNEFLYTDIEALLSEMTEQKAAIAPDFMVVYTHWGVEYETTAGPRYQERAADFVAAGADLIIGSHPHVVQQSERIGDAIVYYSLGNFVFDQYFEPAVQQGLLVKATFTTGEGIAVEEYPILLERSGQTILSR